MSPEAPRAVYDAMVYLQALASPGGPAARCVRLAVDDGSVELRVSRHVLLEVGDILTRPSVRSKFPWITDDEAYELIQKLHAAAAAFPGTPPSLLSLPRDPKDEPYLDLAAAVDARYLVTWNHRHLGYRWTVVGRSVSRSAHGARPCGLWARSPSSASSGRARRPRRRMVRPDRCRGRPHAGRCWGKSDGGRPSTRMNVLVCHNFYQRPGGEDQVFADEVALLRSAGHAVETFTVHNDAVAGPAGGGTLLGKLGLAANTLWNRRVAREIAGLVRRHRADVVHFHNTFPLISPAAYYAARGAGAAVVQTLHNYRLLCPGSLLLRDGKVCEDCLGKTLPLAGAVHKCYRGDRAASAVTAAMLGGHRLIRTYHRAVDVYVALTEFARAKFVQGGFPAGKIAVKPNFILEDRGPGTGGGGYALYVGRLDEGKGIEVLLPAWQQVRGDFELRIMGDGVLAPLVRAAAERDPRVRYLGRRPMDEVFAAMGDAAFMVLSSVWYEGLPKTVVEAFSRGTPIVASALGALAELIEPGKTGLHFRPGDAADLARQMQWALERPAALAAMRAECRNRFEGRYTAAENTEQLERVYRRAIEQRHRSAEASKC